MNKILYTKNKFKFRFLMIITIVGFGIGWVGTLWVGDNYAPITFFVGNGLLLTGLILHYLLWSKEMKHEV